MNETWGKALLARSVKYWLTGTMLDACCEAKSTELSQISERLTVGQSVSVVDLP